MTGFSSPMNRVAEQEQSRIARIMRLLLFVDYELEFISGFRIDMGF